MSMLFPESKRIEEVRRGALYKWACATLLVSPFGGLIFDDQIGLGVCELLDKVGLLTPVECEPGRYAKKYVLRSKCGTRNSTGTPCQRYVGHEGYHSSDEIPTEGSVAWDSAGRIQMCQKKQEGVSCELHMEHPGQHQFPAALTCGAYPAGHPDLACIINEKSKHALHLAKSKVTWSAEEDKIVYPCPAKLTYTRCSFPRGHSGPHGVA